MNRLSRRRLLWGFLAVALGGTVGAAVWTSQRFWPRQGGWDERALEGLKNFGTVPDFSLMERSGKPFGLADLRDKIWIANFIYTNCKDTCPLQSAEMARLQNDLMDKTDVKLVSISVDPERDTPQALSQYAGRFKADPDRWLFLTGEKREIYRIAQEGFRLSAAPASNAGRENDASILHSARFVLVDGKAQIRGYYQSTDAEAMTRLSRDLKTLLGKDKR